MIIDRINGFYLGTFAHCVSSLCLLVSASLAVMHMSAILFTHPLGVCLTGSSCLMLATVICCALNVAWFSHLKTANAGQDPATLQLKNYRTLTERSTVLTYLSIPHTQLQFFASSLGMSWILSPPLKVVPGVFRDSSSCASFFPRKKNVDIRLEWVVELAVGRQFMQKTHNFATFGGGPFFHRQDCGVIFFSAQKQIHLQCHPRATCFLTTRMCRGFFPH